MNENYLAISIHAAKQAGVLIEQGFETTFEISYKEGKHNLVTEYDRKSEELIKKEIRSHFNDHGFLCEEGGKEHLSADYVWVIDPLDGTVNFAHGVPVFTVSIALLHKGIPQVAAIYQPMTRELFTGQKGKGAFLNGKKLQVSSNKDLDEAFLATGFPYNVEENPLHCIDTLFHLLKKGSPIRRLGAATLDLAYVAAGRFDAYFEVILQPWDFAAGWLLVEEAGGVVTTYQNKRLTPFDPMSCVASNPHLHLPLIELLNLEKI